MTPEPAANDSRRDALDTLLESMARALPGADLTAVSLPVRIGRLAALFTRALENEVRPYGFGHGELEVLLFLLSAGKPYQMRPKELMNGCFVTGGAVTGRVDRLEKLGIVTRVASLMDGREMVVQLTQSGERLARRLQENAVKNSAWTEILTQLSPETRTWLDCTIRELLFRMEDQRAAKLEETAPRKRSRR